MSERKYFFLCQKKIIFIGVMQDVRDRERDCFPKKKIGKQPIKNKPHFYKSFPLAKDNFQLTNLFLCYQTLKNVEKYPYRKFFSETNRTLEV